MMHIHVVLVLQSVLPRAAGTDPAPAPAPDPQATRANYEHLRAAAMMMDRKEARFLEDFNRRFKGSKGLKTFVDNEVRPKILSLEGQVDEQKTERVDVLKHGGNSRPGEGFDGKMGESQSMIDFVKENVSNPDSELNKLVGTGPNAPATSKYLEAQAFFVERKAAVKNKIVPDQLSSTSFIGEEDGRRLSSGGDPDERPVKTQVTDQDNRLKVVKAHYKKRALELKDMLRRGYQHLHFAMLCGTEFEKDAFLKYFGRGDGSDSSYDPPSTFRDSEENYILKQIDCSHTTDNKPQLRRTGSLQAATAFWEGYPNSGPVYTTAGAHAPKNDLIQWNANDDTGKDEFADGTEADGAKAFDFSGNIATANREGLGDPLLAIATKGYLKSQLYWEARKSEGPDKPENGNPNGKDEVDWLQPLDQPWTKLSSLSNSQTNIKPVKLDIGHVNYELETATKRIAELQGKYNAHMNKQKNDAKRVFRRVNAERKEFMSSQELLDSAAINLLDTAIQHKMVGIEKKYGKEEADAYTEYHKKHQIDIGKYAEASSLLDNATTFVRTQVEEEFVKIIEEESKVMELVQKLYEEGAVEGNARRKEAEMVVENEITGLRQDVSDERQELDSKMTEDFEALDREIRDKGMEISAGAKSHRARLKQRLQTIQFDAQQTVPVILHAIKALKIPFEHMFQEATAWQRSFRTGDGTLRRKALGFVRQVARHVLQIKDLARRAAGLGAEEKEAAGFRAEAAAAVGLRRLDAITAREHAAQERLAKAAAKAQDDRASVINHKLRIMAQDATREQLNFAEQQKKSAGALRDTFAKLERLQRAEQKEAGKFKQRAAAVDDAFALSEKDMAATTTEIATTNNETLEETIAALLDPVNGLMAKATALSSSWLSYTDADISQANSEVSSLNAKEKTSMKELARAAQTLAQKKQASEKSLASLLAKKQATLVALNAQFAKIAPEVKQAELTDFADPMKKATEAAARSSAAELSAYVGSLGAAVKEPYLKRVRAIMESVVSARNAIDKLSDLKRSELVASTESIEKATAELDRAEPAAEERLKEKASLAEAARTAVLDAAKRAGGEERAVAKLERASEGRQAEILAERSEGYIGRIIASADNIGEKEEAELRSVVGASQARIAALLRNGDLDDAERRRLIKAEEAKAAAEVERLTGVVFAEGNDLLGFEEAEKDAKSRLSKDEQHIGAKLRELAAHRTTMIAKEKRKQATVARHLDNLVGGVTTTLERILLAEGGELTAAQRAALGRLTVLKGQTRDMAQKHEDEARALARLAARGVEAFTDAESAGSSSLGPEAQHVLGALGALVESMGLGSVGVGRQFEDAAAAREAALNGNAAFRAATMHNAIEQAHLVSGALDSVAADTRAKQAALRDAIAAVVTQVQTELTAQALRENGNMHNALEVAEDGEAMVWKDGKFVRAIGGAIEAADAAAAKTVKDMEGKVDAGEKASEAEDRRAASEAAAAISQAEKRIKGAISAQVDGAEEQAGAFRKEGEKWEKTVGYRIGQTALADAQDGKQIADTTNARLRGAVSEEDQIEALVRQAKVLVPALSQRVQTIGEDVKRFNHFEAGGIDKERGDALAALRALQEQAAAASAGAPPAPKPAQPAAAGSAVQTAEADHGGVSPAQLRTALARAGSATARLGRETQADAAELVADLASATAESPPGGTRLDDLAK